MINSYLSENTALHAENEELKKKISQYDESYRKLQSQYDSKNTENNTFQNSIAEKEKRIKNQTDHIKSIEEKLIKFKNHSNKESGLI